MFLCCQYIFIFCFFLGSLPWLLTWLPFGRHVYVAVDPLKPQDYDLSIPLHVLDVPFSPPTALPPKFHVIFYLLYVSIETHRSTKGTHKCLYMYVFVLVYTLVDMYIFDAR